ncbi:hypothetical protein SAMN04488574_12035 [Bacillus sp. 71mf]|nr:hypothetical protein SAMN04488574_12035 [Bacillus sp. 71mf]SFT13655.1 hypothetical protein SAMN04488145_11320 [Bacillus sp. 103mf]
MTQKSFFELLQKYIIQIGEESFYVLLCEKS